jgi:hypothetical protein
VPTIGKSKNENKKERRKRKRMKMIEGRRDEGWERNK